VPDSPDDDAKPRPRLDSQGKYVADHRAGVWTTFDPDGWKSETTYEDDRPTGKGLVFDESGKEVGGGKYVDGHKSGTWRDHRWNGIGVKGAALISGTYGVQDNGTSFFVGTWEALDAEGNVLAAATYPTTFDGAAVPWKFADHTMCVTALNDLHRGDCD
jgi:hypothetical protein